MLNRDHHDPAQQLPLEEIVVRVVTVAQALLEKPYYAYQVELGTRIVESLLEHDGDVITSLMARQAGKTECIGGVVAAIAIVLPILAKKYKGDWRLNITDDAGNYRGFRNGVKIGIYAPRQDQAAITFERVTRAMDTKSAKKVLVEGGIRSEVNNGNEFVLTNGSRILCQSASEQSKIEGETHHLLVLEEAQHVSDMKVRKSLHPMTASTMGTIVKIGTAATQKCDFYQAIQENRRLEMMGQTRNHFFFPWSVCSRYNSLYRKYIEKEKGRIGEDSDEFRMSYNGEWIFERGMFVTPDSLFNKRTAMTEGLWSVYHKRRAHLLLKNYSIVAGFDWGSSADSTIMCLMAVDWNTPIESGSFATAEGLSEYTFYKKHVIGWHEWHGDSYEAQFHEAMELLAPITNLRKVVTDSNTCGKPIYDRLVAAFGNRHVRVEPFNFQPKVKSDGYRSLAGDLDGRRLTFPAGPSVRAGKYYRRFAFQMLDLKKDYHNGLLQVAHPDERGAHDDYCFPAGSPVITENGPVAIDQIVPGMRVMTSKGLRRVLVAAQTGVKPLVRVGNLVGTANHPVFCENKNTYVRLDSLMSDDTVLEWKTEKSSPETASDGPATRILNGDSSVNTSGLTPSGRLLPSLYIDTSGKNTEARYQKAGLSTTKMETVAITGSLTSLSGLVHDTRANMLPSPPVWPWLSSAYAKLKKLLSFQVGTDLLKESGKPKSEQPICGMPAVTGPASVQSAKSPMKPAQLGLASLVPTSVQHVVGDARALQAFEQFPNAAVPVYNLQVEEVNEFICQGVLVHNCDALMMAAWGCSTPSMMELDFQKSNPFFN